ncbi:hypothetical protein [Pseudolactococcus laudensis]
MGEITWSGDGEITVAKLNQASVKAGKPEISETYHIAITQSDDSW